MSEYCYRKVIRMKISVEEVCKIFGVEDGWCVSDLLDTTEFSDAIENTKFEIPPYI